VAGDPIELEMERNEIEKQNERELSTKLFPAEGQHLAM
jgi:hypothetical protein